MQFPVAETRDRRRLSLNVMLNCRTLLPDVDADDELLNCFDYGRQDSRNCNRVACRRGTSSYKASADAREEDITLRSLCFKAFLDGVTLSQLKLYMGQETSFPLILIPELFSWAIHLDKSPRILLSILKRWPSKQFRLSEIFPLAFESKSSWGLTKRSRFRLNGFNTIAFGSVSKAYAWRYDSAVTAIISAITKLQEEIDQSNVDSKVEVFDLTGVPLSDPDFASLAQLTTVTSSASAVQRSVLVDLSAEDIVTNNIMEILQRNKSPWRIYAVKCFWHCRLKKASELQELLTTLNSRKTQGFSLSFSGLHNKLVRETLPGIIRLENLTSLDLSTNLLDFVSNPNRNLSTVQDLRANLCSELTRSLNYILQHLKNLSRLNLGGSRLTGQLGDMFFGIHNKFRYLGLSGCFLSDKDLKSIGENSCFHDITELNICYNVLHGRKDELGTVFTKLSNLKILEMECNHLRGEEIGQIFANMSHTLRNLVCLNISCEFTRNVIWTFSNVISDVLPQVMLMASLRYLQVPHIERQGFCREPDCELGEELQTAVTSMQQKRLENNLRSVMIDWKCSIW